MSLDPSDIPDPPSGRESTEMAIIGGMIGMIVVGIIMWAGLSNFNSADGNVSFVTSIAALFCGVATGLLVKSYN
jgi:hypothetical protein